MIDAKIETLLSVVDSLNFTETARRLNMTQPAVSHHIKLLEEELGIRIFNRTEKKLILTEEGKIAVRYARRIKNLYGGLKQELEDEKKRIRRLTIGVTPTAENNIVSQVLAIYGAEHPDIHITVISDTIKNIYDKLRTYEISIAIIEGALAHPDSYNSVLLDTDYLVLAVSNDNPLSSRSVVTLEELKQEKMILRLPDSGTRSLFENSLAGKNQSLSAFNVILEVDNNAAIKELVRGNFGVSVISKSSCVDEVRKNKFRILPIENLSMVREIQIVYAKDFTHTEILDEIARIYHRKMGR